MGINHAKIVPIFFKLSWHIILKVNVDLTFSTWKNKFQIAFFSYNFKMIILIHIGILIL